MIRNLIFYCYPLKGSIWAWHVGKVAHYREVWNGRRLAVISLNHLTEDESVVRKHLDPCGVEVLVRKNHVHLQEAAHFIEALSMLESHRRDEATFYCHAKGVTRSESPLNGALKWSDLMYRANLEVPEAVDRRLEKYPAVGCLRWDYQRTPFKWCFAGTFFWLRHDALFSRNWRDIEQARYGVEDYPGRHFQFSESSCLTREQIPPAMLYDGWINEDFTLKAVEKLRGEICTPR